VIIIGIDPSLNSTGICLMNGETGEIGETIVIQPNDVGQKRLAYFRQEITNLITMRSNLHAFIEGYAFGANNQREALGELGGVLRLALYDASIPIVIVPPTTLKKFATGKGAADKVAMGVQLMKEFRLSYPTTDQTDAHWLCCLGRAYHSLMPNLSKAREEIIDAIKNPKMKKRTKATTQK